MVHEKNIKRGALVEGWTALEHLLKKIDITEAAFAEIPGENPASCGGCPQFRKNTVIRNDWGKNDQGTWGMAKMIRDVKPREENTKGNDKDVCWSPVCGSKGTKQN